MLLIIFFILAVVIGFGHVDYTIEEKGGTVILSVSVQHDNIIPEAQNIIITLTTSDDTAQCMLVLLVFMTFSAKCSMMRCIILLFHSSC